MYGDAMLVEISDSELAVRAADAGQKGGDDFATEADLAAVAAGIALCVGARCVATELSGASLDSGNGLLVAADSIPHQQLLTHVQQRWP